MSLPALDRKLLREIARLKGQVATIAIVLASGVTCFIALRGNYESLEWAQQAYYDHYRFAHVFARAKRAPETLARRIEALPGVARVQTRISEEVALPIEGMERSAYARLLSLPPNGEPATNALQLRQGRFPARARQDEVVVLESFARQHGLAPGHRLSAVINGKLRSLKITGIAMSPEFVYSIRPGALVDDPKRYAVLWMERSALAAAFQLDSAFNEVSLRLQPGASEAGVAASLDTLLAPYGNEGAITRQHQVSNRILTDELSQLRALAGMVPLVFLGVAAFLVNMVLGRLIAMQRQEIAMLKAVGYSNREVGRHYLGLALVVMIPGGLLGVLGGVSLGRVVLDIYAAIFRFPDLYFRMTPRLVATSLLVSLLAALLGALVAVRGATRLPPAQAMRPPSPLRYHSGLFDRLGLGALAGPSGMMVLRELWRRPLRTALSSLGIAGAVALLILGRFALDSLDSYLEGTLRREQRQDLAVAFEKPLSPRVIGQLQRMHGVLSAEGLRAVPVRIRHEHRMRDAVLIGVAPRATLRRLVERGGSAVDVPEDGVLLTRALGEILGVHVGERAELELREGDRPTVRPLVAGFVDETVGLSIYGQSSLIAQLEGDLGAVSSVLLRVDPEQLSAIKRELQHSPYVIDVSELHSDIQRLRDMNGSAMDVWTAVSITLASCVIFGVVYNNARIALAMRSRDLATLRVLGLSRREISSILIGSLATEVALAIPIGLWAGRKWGELFMKSVDQETFRWAVVVAPRTYALATFVALFAAAASALWVRRSLDRLDLIGVLKTRE